MDLSTHLAGRKWLDPMEHRLRLDHKPDYRVTLQNRKLQPIAKRTEAVGRLIYYPFIMPLSQSPHYDNWDMPLDLVVVITAALAYALIFGFILRRAAERARSKASSKRWPMHARTIHPGTPRPSPSRFANSKAAPSAPGASSHCSRRPCGFWETPA